jgi:hypothetical protein
VDAAIVVIGKVSVSNSPTIDPSVTSQICGACRFVAMTAQRESPENSRSTGSKPPTCHLFSSLLASRSHRITALHQSEESARVPSGDAATVSTSWVCP